MKKIFTRILLVIVIIVAGLYIYVMLTWNKSYSAPEPPITASTDSALIERGRYLAFGPAHCGTCHIPMDKIMEVEDGLQIPLSGGWELAIPPGTFRAPNITPDKETGIGNVTDGQLARAMRYSVSHDNKALMPFMPFQELSDQDLTAIISFLRSQPPVKNVVKRTEYTFLGKALMAFGMIKPVGPAHEIPKSITIDTSVTYGKYLVHNVANCYGCHTNRDMKTGEFIGEPLAGGLLFEPDAFSNGFSHVTPNLTPSPTTGVMKDWTVETFLHRFHTIKRVHEFSPMPWGSFSRINETELRAIFYYLESIKPVDNKIEQTVIPPAKS